MANETEYLLHIGRHKTGTTSLQRALSAHAAELRRCGVWYPLAGKEGIAHHALANACTKKQRRESPALSLQVIDDFKSQLKQEISAWSGRVLFSSEAFQNAAPALVEELFPRQQTRILVYLREQAEYAVSSYQQAVHARQLEQSMEQFLRRPGVNYAEFLREWSGEFGEDALDVRVYDRKSLLNGSIVQDFLQLAGVSASLAEDTHDHNPSIGGVVLELKRVLNVAFSAATMPQRVYAAFSALAGSNAKFRVRPGLKPESLHRLRSGASASNALVAARYFGRERLFADAVVAEAAREAPMVTDFQEALAFLLTDHAAVGAAVLDALLFRAPAADGAEVKMRERLAARLLGGESGRLIPALRSYSKRCHEGQWQWNFDFAW